MKGTPNLKRNTLPNERILVSTLKLARKRETHLKTLASFFIIETTIGKIASTILNPRNSKAKTRNWKEEKESQENRRTRKEIDDESSTSTEEFRMIIDISTSSDSNETKYP